MATTSSRIVRLSSTGPARETDHLLDALGRDFEFITEDQSHITSPLPSRAVNVDLSSAIRFPGPTKPAAFHAEGVSVRLFSECEVVKDLNDLHRWLCRTFKCGETAVDQGSLEFTVWVDGAPLDATNG